MRPFSVSVRAFTRLPVAGLRGIQASDSPDTVARAIRWYPLIGVVVGVAMTLAYALAAAVLPHALSVVVALAVAIVIAGAQHEGGLAGTCDGLGGGHGRDDVLRIMRDARIGAFGAAAIVLVLLARFEALASIQLGWEAVAFVGSQSASRALAVATMLTLKPLRPAAGMASVEPFAGPVHLRDGLIGIVVGLAPLGVLALASPDARPIAAAVGLALLAVLLLRWRLARRLGGYTHETVGAAQQLADAAFLAGLVGYTLGVDAGLVGNPA